MTRDRQHVIHDHVQHPASRLSLVRASSFVAVPYSKYCTYNPTQYNLQHSVLYLQYIDTVQYILTVLYIQYILYIQYTLYIQYILYKQFTLYIQFILYRRGFEPQPPSLARC